MSITSGDMKVLLREIPPFLAAERERLYGYYCKGCNKLLMPNNLEEVERGDASAVYVHNKECEIEVFGLAEMKCEGELTKGGSKS